MKKVCFLIGALARAVVVAFIIFVFVTLFNYVFKNQLSSPLPDDPSGFNSLVRFLAEIVKSLFPWPIVCLAAILAVAKSPSFFAFLIGFMRLFRKVSFLGAEVELNQATQRQLKAAAHDLTEALKEYRSQVADTLAKFKTQYDLDGEFFLFMNSLEKRLLSKRPIGFRATLHIPDVVLAGYLLQLLDYYPNGTGAGRAFSERFGIIGKVWRTEGTEIVGNLIPRKESIISAPVTVESEPSEADDLRLMKSEWGMNQVEATKALQHPSYCCCIVRSDQDNSKIGILYMDSTVKDAFKTKDGKELAKEDIEAFLKDSKIPKLMEKAVNQVTEVSIQVQLT